MPQRHIDRLRPGSTLPDRVRVTATGRAAALEAIADEVRTCTRCRLATGRTRAVPGEGSPDTEVVFVGEGPGQNEDQQGRPFVGAAGGLLTELIGSIGWRRDEVFITNVVKCRPPGNRDPEPDEMAACAPFLRRQLEVIDPALVVTLGRFSLSTFMPGARIGQVHGQSRPADPATGTRDAVAFAMYHPAAAFRQMALKETMREDMARIPEALIAARQGRVPAPGIDLALASDVAPVPAPATYVAPTQAPSAPPMAPMTADPVEPEPMTADPVEPEPMTADPVEPEPIVHVDEIAEAHAAIELDPADLYAIPQEPPPETDQMRLF